MEPDSTRQMLAPKLDDLPKSKSEARERAWKIINSWTVGSAATAWVPGAALLSALTDQMMISQVAKLYGVAHESEALTKHRAAIAAGTIGAITAGSTIGAIASEALTFFPVVGWAMKSGLIAAKVRLIGNHIVRYFELKSDLPD